MIRFGENDQLQFNNEEDLYASIGYICNPNNAHITFETNSQTNSYSDAYRIKLLQPLQAPEALRCASRTAGRINCNKFVKMLLNNFGFMKNNKIITGDINIVSKHIPLEYYSAFLFGYNS